MSNEAEKFREYARACREMVPRMPSPEAKQKLLTIADAWEELARPAGAFSPNGTGPRSVTSAEVLRQRPSRLPDHAAENLALIGLAQSMAKAPEDILQRLADTALIICRAHSAGLSLLEDSDQRRNFHWRAIAGEFSHHLNGGTPRDFGPCGTVLDRNAAQLCSHPEIDFPYFSDAKPPLEEILLVPFYIEGTAVGTIWIVSHDVAKRRFDAEDLRVMSNLAIFASAAYQTYLTANTSRQFAAIVQSSDDAIISKNLDGIITSWNPGAERIFGYSAEEAVGKAINILIPEDRQNEEPAILQRLRLGERIDHFETVRRRKDGSTLDISLTISPVKNAAGAIIGASKIARDISERKRAQAHITMLAREAEHRAKNVLATVEAVVHLTKAGTAEGFKEAVSGRIRALANVHRLFVETRWEGADIRSIATEELSAYTQDRDARIQISGPRILLEPSAAQAIAVVLHELTTNAAKYGALSVPDGRLQIEWSHDSVGSIVLHWVETDGPPVELPKSRGFGSRVMETMIRNQLKGGLNFDWRHEGLACDITLPVICSTA
jgi:PAS domain S-box-containing protein